LLYVTIALLITIFAPHIVY